MALPAPATRRVNRGRNHEYYVDGRKVPSVTGILRDGLPKHALVGWAARAVTELVIAKRDVLHSFTQAELWDLLTGAPWRDRDDAGNRGTEVHTLAARMARGEAVVVPPELTGRVDSYVQWWQDWQPDDSALVERSIINRQHGYAGTFDLYTPVLHNAPELGRCLLDLKTARSGVFAESALQLVGYGHGETLLERVGPNQWLEQPMPAVDTYGVVWVKPDGYEFVVCDVGEWEWAVFLYAKEIANWMRQRAGDKADHPVITPPLVTPNLKPDLRIVS